MGNALAGKVVLITGAGRGIGRATAEQFAREAAHVVICARTQSELDATIGAIRGYGGDAVARRTDIADATQAEDLLQFVLRTHGRLDILINNAGTLGPRASIVDYPISDWATVLQVNLTGTFYVSRLAGRAMVNQQSGTIITISSSVGRQGRAGWGAYAVSKFGVEGLSQVMADELKSHGVRVVTFNPGGTRTRMRAEAYPEEDATQLRSPGQAAAALLALAVNPSLDLTGRALSYSDLL